MPIHAEKETNMPRVVLLLCCIVASFLVLLPFCTSSKAFIAGLPQEVGELFNRSRMDRMPENATKLPSYLVNLLRVRSGGDGVTSLPYGADAVRYFTGEVPSTSEDLVRFHVKIKPRDVLLEALLQITDPLHQGVHRIHGLQRITVFDADSQILLVNRIVLPMMQHDGGSVVSTFITAHVRDSLSHGVDDLRYRIRLNPLAATRSPQLTSQRRGQRHEFNLFVFASSATQKSVAAHLSGSIEEHDATPPARQRQQRGNMGCELADLNVDFRSLGFKHILAPAGYNARQCNGECLFPFGTGARATNHAMIQSMMWSILAENGSARRVQCVPTALAPMKMLYIENEKDKTLIVREFQNMVAVACGCR